VLVEINLLPQKQQKRSITVRIIIMIALTMLLISLLTFWQVQKYNNEIRHLEANIANFEQSITSLQQEVNVESTNSYVELSNAVEWSLTYPIKSVAVLKHLTSLLPERGFLLTYSYTETGLLSLTVQFDTKKEAAYYLSWLSESPWIEEVKLLQLSSSQIEATEGTPEIQGENKTESYLPRYIGNFEITLNREAIRLAQQQAEGTENQNEGGSNQ
jgi:type IV pilus assembly protein PilN